MSYSEITFSDRNPIKRWLQRQRLSVAVKLCHQLSRPPGSICDFGAGNGELCKRLSDHFPNANLTCYEPTPDLLEEARENLAGKRNVVFYQDIQGVDSASFDLVLCLEVLEHLPPKEISAALEKMTSLVRPDGFIVIGVPVETGIPALYKGIFRMARRYGAFDANIRNVALAFTGHPPQQRPLEEITPGFNYYWEHMGFSSRGLEKTLCSQLDLRTAPVSAWTWLQSLLMPEVNFVIDQANRVLHRSY